MPSMLCCFGGRDARTTVKGEHGTARPVVRRKFDSPTTSMPSSSRVSFTTTSDGRVSALTYTTTQRV
jgi:hypothetical protein